VKVRKSSSKREAFIVGDFVNSWWLGVTSFELSDTPRVNSSAPAAADELRPPLRLS
jgi:hypothetical protein